MIANHVDFSIAFRNARGAYDTYIRQTLRAVFAAMDPRDRREVEDENLEQHIRDYVIDPLLEALNWHVGKNTIAEAFIWDRQRQTRRRLDYLGYEQETNLPLLIVEAKRPDAPLIDVSSGSERGHSFRPRELLIEALHHLKDPQQKRPPLINLWYEWLVDVRDYCISVEQNTGIMPPRMILTNGTWLIIFSNLEDAFRGDEKPSASHIWLYETPDDILSNAREVFELLNYGKLTIQSGPILPGLLAAHFDVTDFEFGVGALHIFYADTPAGREAMPLINVIPEIILRHKNNGWIRVTSERKERLPHRWEYLSQHLSDVVAAQRSLIEKIEAVLGKTLAILSISDHYRKGFNTELPGLHRFSTEQYIALTGRDAHFIQDAAEFDACRFHWVHLAAINREAAEAVPVSVSTAPRTHFGTGTPMNCSHRTVQVLKGVQISPDNRERYAPRTETEDGPFCKLWGFETFLCCKRCVYQPVCHESVGPMMPCRRDKGVEP